MGCSLLVVKAALNFSSRYPVRNIGVIYISDPFTSAGYCFGDFFAARTTVTFCSYGYLANALPHAVVTHLGPSNVTKIRRSGCTQPVLDIMMRSKYQINNQKRGWCKKMITLVFYRQICPTRIQSPTGRMRLVSDHLLYSGQFLEPRRRHLLEALLTSFLPDWIPPSQISSDGQE